MRRNKPCQSHQPTGFQETTATALGNIHLDLATVKFANSQALGCKDAGNYSTAQTHGETCRGRWSRKERRGGRQKWLQRGPVACKTGLVSTVVWQSPTPDWCSVSSSYIFVLKHILTTFLCKLTLYPMSLSAARTKCQMLRRSMCARVKFGASHWSQIENVDTPGLFCQILGRVEVSQCELLEQVGVFNLQLWGRNHVCSQNQLLEGTGVRQVRGQCQWLEWDHGSQLMCLVWAAWESLYPHQTWRMWGVRV